MHLTRRVVAIDGSTSPGIAVLSVAKTHTLVGIETELSTSFRVEAPPDAILHAIVDTHNGVTYIVQLVGCGHLAVCLHLGEESGIVGEGCCLRPSNPSNSCTM